VNEFNLFRGTISELAPLLAPIRLPSTRRPLRLLIGRAAYETAIRMFPQDAIQYRNGAQIIARSDQESGLGTKNA
jgi:hypothetical protein